MTLNYAKKNNSKILMFFEQMNALLLFYVWLKDQVDIYIIHFKTNS